MIGKIFLKIKRNLVKYIEILYILPSFFYLEFENKTLNYYDSYGTTGLLEDDGVETLPFFDDYDIEYNDALLMRQFAENALNNINAIQGFKSGSLDKFLVIINTIIEKKLH